ncbi:cell wall binding protein [Microbacterium phage FireCastle]
MDECKDNYVVSCNPAPMTPSSEVVTVQHAPEPLPPTGLDGGDAILVGFFGLLALVVGAAMVALRRGER